MVGTEYMVAASCYGSNANVNKSLLRNYFKVVKCGREHTTLVFMSTELF